MMYSAVLLWVCFVSYVCTQVQEQLKNKLVCIEHEECGPCLSAAVHCRWCADPYYPSTAPRCNDDESLVAFGCGQSMIQRPDKPVWEVVDNRSLQDMFPGSLEAVNDFIESVNKSAVTANLDNAEAQLDALVQAITCRTEVGWAQHSRKIVILLSDGLLHTAGDGKLGGAALKNDETCHLDENGYYSEAAKYDYPSIAQVYRLLDKYKVNIILC
ncbi:unnamed protein product, partial [Leptidea sinapis]